MSRRTRNWSYGAGGELLRELTTSSSCSLVGHGYEFMAPQTVPQPPPKVCGWCGRHNASDALRCVDGCGGSGWEE
jgi:hypothetical protein